MQKAVSPPPLVFDFLDVVHFLESHFAWRKKKNASFTYSAWSEELGFNNKTLLRFILLRRRKISPRTCEAFKKNLGLANDEAKYFDLLICHGRAKTESERQAFSASLLRAQRDRYGQKEVAASLVAKHHFGPVILTLLTFQDARLRLKDLATLLDLEVGVVQEVVRELIESGVVSGDSGGVLSIDSRAIRIPDAPMSDSLRNFYEYWIDRSKSAIELPYEERRFRNLKIALSREEYEMAVERINAFAMMILSQFHTDVLQDRRLYMFNTALFPVTEIYDLKTKDRSLDEREVDRSI